MKLSIDRLTVNVLWMNGCLFYLGFIFGPAYFRVNPEYSLTTDLIVFKIIIFILLLMLFLLRVGTATISHRLLLIYSVILLSGVYALALGIIYNNDSRFLFRHLGNFTVFAISAYLASTVKLDPTYLFSNAKKYVNLIGAVSVVTLIWAIAEQPEGTAFSFGLYGLGIPIAYYIVGRNDAVALFYLVTSFFTGKRALYLSAILIFLTPRSRTIRERASVAGGKIRKALLINVTVLLCAFLIAGGITKKAIDNLSSRIEYGTGDNISNMLFQLDVVSSGRLTDVNSVLSTLIDENKLLTGMGYGAAYDSYAYSNSFKYASIGYSSTWYKSGSDIQPAHYVLQYGVVVGLALYGMHILFLIYSLVKSVNHRWYRFLTLSYMFYLVASLFTYVPADPMWGFLVGMLLKCAVDTGGLQILTIRGLRGVG